MHMFWQRPKVGKHRFQQVKCSGCGKVTRVGKWLRRPHETHNSIEKWLKHNSTYNCCFRDVTMTVDLFLTQDISEGLLGATDMARAAVTEDIDMAADKKEDNRPEEQRKHVKRPLLPEHNTNMKRRRCDTQASCATASATAVQTGVELCYAQTLSREPVSVGGLREDIDKGKRSSHGTSDALEAVIVHSAPLTPQSMAAFHNEAVLTERRRRILRESNLLPHVRIARRVPVSQALQHFLQRRFRTQVSLHSMEVGGNGDCLFHSVAAGLEHLLLESTAASRHVLHRIPLTVFSSGKLAVVQHLRNMCAQQIETWSWEELLNYFVRASMDQNLGEWRDEWNPSDLLRDHNLEVLIGCDAVRAVSDNPNGDVGDIFIIIDKSDARVGGNTSQQLQTPIAQGRAFLIALRVELQVVFRTLGNTHWGDSTDARLLTDALDVGFFLFADELQGNRTQCLVALDLSRTDFPYFLALWWNNHSHFRSLEIKTSSDTPFRACWPRFQAPQTLLDEYHAVNRANTQ